MGSQGGEREDCLSISTKGREHSKFKSNLKFYSLNGSRYIQLVNLEYVCDKIRPYDFVLLKSDPKNYWTCPRFEPRAGEEMLPLYTILKNSVTFEIITWELCLLNVLFGYEYSVKKLMVQYL